MLFIPLLYEKEQYELTHDYKGSVVSVVVATYTPLV